MGSRAAAQSDVATLSGVVRFHAGVGSRLALREVAPAFAAAFGRLPSWGPAS